MISLRQRFLPLLLLALLLQACEAERTVSWEQISHFSPPLVQTREDPWPSAQKIAASVPNSRFVVGHGNGMLPLYPTGTVLVLQSFPGITSSRA